MKMQSKSVWGEKDSKIRRREKKLKSLTVKNGAQYLAPLWHIASETKQASSGALLAAVSCTRFQAYDCRGDFGDLS